MTATLNIIADPRINRKEFAHRYSVWLSKCEDYASREVLCEVLSHVDGVLSIKNEYGESDIHILAVADLSVKKRMDVAVKRDEVADAVFTVVPELLCDVEDQLLIQLLLNAMARHDIDEASNISGEFYRVNELIKNRSGRLNEIITLKISVFNTSASNGGEAVAIKCGVATFTNTRLFKKEDMPRRNLPRYALEDSRLIKIRGKYDGETFIRRKPRSTTRNTVPLLDFGDDDELRRSKATVIMNIISSFNRRYAGIADLTLAEVPVETFQITDSLSAYRDRAKKIVCDVPLTVIDCVGNANALQKLEEGLNAGEYIFTVTNQKTLDSKIIRIVRPADSYKEGKSDPYRADDIMAVQHVTDEVLIKTKNPSVLADSLVEQLAIKSDVANGKISLYDWSAFSGEGVYSFALPVKTEERLEDVAVMEIRPDGFTTYALHSYEDDDCPEWIREISSDDMEWAVRHPDGRCMRVSRTDIIAIPDAKGVKTTIDYNKANCIRERTKTIKSKEGHLDEYFVECTDINLIPGTDTSMLYYVGVRERDLKMKVQNASNVYAVDGPDGLFMDRMIPLMDVPFVRHAQYTVTPFPVKYLREFVLTRTR